MSVRPSVTSRLRPTAGVLAALAIAAPRPALAEESAADVATARTLGIEGVKLADAGKCEDAVDRLSRSERLHHAPVVLERLGECQIALGRFVEGSENLQKVIREELPKNAPSVAIAAKSRASKAIEAARGKVGKLVVSVSGPSTEAVNITLDGVAVSTAYLGVSRPTDPGDHELVVSAAGFKTATRKVSLALGASESVVVTLEPEPTAPPPSEGPGVTPPPARGTSGRTIAGIGSLAVGGVGLVAGGVFGVLALGKKNSLDGQCIDKACPAGTQSTIDTATTFANVSTIGFVVGGVGVAAGVTLLLWPTKPAATSQALSVRPLVGPGSLGIAGTF